MTTYVADTYAWMEYLGGNLRYKERMHNPYVKTSILSLGELSRSFTRKGIEQEEQDEFLEFVKKKSYIIPITEELIIYAGRLAEQEKIPLADAIIYANALPLEKLLTGGDHFKGKKYVEFVK